VNGNRVARAPLAPAVFTASRGDRTTIVVAAIGVAALALLPWAATGGPSAFARAFAGETPALALCALAVLVVAFAWRGMDRAVAVLAALALVVAFGAGFLAGPGGPAFGLGAAAALAALTVCLARGLARNGFCRGDATVATSVVAIALLLVIFIFYPVGRSLTAALFDARGVFAPAVAAQRLFTEDLWGLGCFGGGSGWLLTVHRDVASSRIAPKPASMAGFVVSRQHVH